MKKSAEEGLKRLRIWLCGGEIVVARDSRVAHVFRRHFPYAVNNTEIYINKVRRLTTYIQLYYQVSLLWTDHHDDITGSRIL